jgi:hypothetical protein
MDQKADSTWCLHSQILQCAFFYRCVCVCACMHAHISTCMHTHKCWMKSSDLGMLSFKKYWNSHMILHTWCIFNSSELNKKCETRAWVRAGNRGKHTVRIKWQIRFEKGSYRERRVLSLGRGIKLPKVRVWSVLPAFWKISRDGIMTAKGGLLGTQWSVRMILKPTISDGLCDQQILRVLIFLFLFHRRPVKMLQT